MPQIFLHDVADFVLGFDTLLMLNSTLAWRMNDLEGRPADSLKLLLSLAKLSSQFGHLFGTCSLCRTNKC